ncbi:MAG: penicillin-binding transpeptidase domain-containing protein [Gammaproteobacteria bacterium]|nr:penicillin-binding transpeptidase domain-containing protein [Gammaproteobacteria bacterium]
MAGKTGTVRKVGPEGYDDDRHIAYFAGFAPSDRPRVTAVVLINEPQVAQSGGGAVAAPVFRAGRCRGAATAQRRPCGRCDRGRGCSGRGEGSVAADDPPPAGEEAA